MNIKRYLYIEQDAERAVPVVTFSKKKEAAAHAAQCLKDTIFKSLGKDYFIPPEHIDENGFIAHSASGVEISSSEWGWSLWWDNIESAHATIEEQTIDLSQTEILNLYYVQNHEFLLEDAKRQLYYYADFDPESDSAYNLANEKDFSDKYGFSIDEAADCGSERYLLENILEQFSDHFDCGIAENDQWYSAVGEVLGRLVKKMTKEGNE